MQESQAEGIVEELTEEMGEVSERAIDRMLRTLHIPWAQLILSAAVVIVLLILLFLLKKLFDRHVLSTDNNLGSRPIRLIYKIVRVILVIMTVMFILQINGVNVSSLVAGLGIAGIVVGFALQDILKDVIMGFHIVMDGFFGVGDVVHYDGIDGIVISFNIMSTKIQNLVDGTVLNVCNRDIVKILKYGDVLDLDLGLSYEDPPEKIHGVLWAVTEKIGQEIAGVTGPEYLGTICFNESSVTYRIRMHCDPMQRADVHRMAVSLAQAELAKAGIRIPYRQLDVHTFSPK